MVGGEGGEGEAILQYMQFNTTPNSTMYTSPTAAIFSIYLCCCYNIQMSGFFKTCHYCILLLLLLLCGGEREGGGGNYLAYFLVQSFAVLA